MHGDQLPRHYESPTEDAASLYGSATSITFGLDSVLFADGKFAGPDTLHRFDRHVNDLNAQRAIGVAVLAFQGRNAEDLGQFLASTEAPARLNQTVRPPNAPPGALNPQSVLRLVSHYSALLKLKDPDNLFQFIERNQPPLDLSVHR